MNGPQVSVGMPVYNNADTIARTLDRFCSQQHRHLEIIISDDCSSDGTEAICRDLARQDARIRYFRQKRNIGSLANHKFVFDLSGGDYFMWCNGHDFPGANYLSCCVQSLEADPSLVLCGGKTQRFDVEGNLRELLYSGLDTAGLGVTERFKKVFRAIQKDAIIFYGVYRSDALRQTELHRKTLGGDLVLLAEMALHGNLLQREDTTFYRRIRPHAATQAQAEWLSYIVQPKGFCLEAVTPWLDMAYEFLRMVVNSSQAATAREALLAAVRDLIRESFGGLLQAEIDKLLAVDSDQLPGPLTRDLCLSEKIVRLNKVRTFCGDPEGLNGLLRQYIDKTCQQAAAPAETPTAVDGDDTLFKKVTQRPHGPMESSKMNLSFVIIVLNGMPFLPYCLDAIYSSAHEIIVVEGAVENCMFAAHPDGSSRDGSVACITSYPDPEHKLRLIQGQWAEKVHMQNKALEFVTGDYVWLVDSDEIYKKDDLARIKALLEKDPSITQVNFIPDNFWKGFDDIFISTRFFEEESHYRRLFKFQPGARFTTHRPPTLYWPGSELCTEQMHLVGGLTTRSMGIIPYHYSYVLEGQVGQKMELYRRYGWGESWQIDMNEWYHECFLKWTPENKCSLERAYPVWTGDRNSRTISFQGSHPEVMARYIESYRAARQQAPSEAAILPVIGNVLYQRQVLEAWQHIELDTPLLERRQIMQENIGAGRSYWNNHVALAFLADRLQPDSYLEVGVRTGGSLVQVLAGSTPRRVVAMDFWDGEYSSLPNHVEYTRNQVQRFQDRLGKAIPIEFIQGDSHLKLKDLIGQGSSFELITIDGDHTLEGAREDLEDALKLLGPKGAILFDDIIHVAHKYLLNLVHEICHRHPELGVLLNSSQDNGCAIFLRNISWQELCAGRKPAKAKGIKIAGEFAMDQDLTKVATESDFARSIRELFGSIKPRKIIETGTYHGEGTTRVITSTLRELGLDGSAFFSIECNPGNYARAVENLRQSGLLPFVRVLNGLSTPRRDLPTYQEIESRFVRDLGNSGFDDIFIDHQEHERALLYFQETDFSNIPDDLLGSCLRHFDYCPDFVLLDSGGHMGNIEFNYLIGALRGPCFIALDDIFHIKHHQSFLQMQKDSRFRIVVSSKEKFGFCIAKFTPVYSLPKAAGEEILWVRPDSIGDNILASSALPHLKGKYPNSRLTVFCQQHVAELYQASPFVDAVIGFNSLMVFQDPEYRDGVIERLRSVGAGLTLNSLYSRAPLFDEFALRSGAGQLIALHGDLSNISAEARDANNGRYTRIIPSEGTQKPELERHRDFLKGLGIEVPRLDPVIWTTPQDEQFADDFFRTNELAPERCLALFAGAQFEYRIYLHYGTALAALCKEQNLSLIALGTEKERALNQENLDASGARALNLCGKLTLRQSAAILRRCRLAVGAETGTAHMACAVGTPNVILLGGGHFGRFMPYSPLTSVVCLPLACYGCNWQCKFSRPHCVKDLNPLVIADAVRQTLESRSEKIRVFCESRALWLPLQEEPGWKGCEELLNYPVEISFFDETPPPGAAVLRRAAHPRLVQSTL